MNEIGDKLFGNHQGKKQEFDEKIERYDMQYDTFTVAKRKYSKETGISDVRDGYRN